MFVVVETINEADGQIEVQAVPTSFFNQERTIYKYPCKNKTTAYINNAIHTCQIPDERDWYEIRDFKIISKDYCK